MSLQLMILAAILKPAAIISVPPRSVWRSSVGGSLSLAVSALAGSALLIVSSLFLFATAMPQALHSELAYLPAVFFTAASDGFAEMLAGDVTATVLVELQKAVGVFHLCLNLYRTKDASRSQP